jgi:predicted nucleic acid-binding protein
MIWIIDASVAVRWLLENETHPHADDVLEKAVQYPQRFAVPELFAFEVYSVLQRMHPGGLQAFTEAIIPLLQGGILRQPMTRSLAVGAEPLVKLGLTGYDACYAALAKQMRGKWLTFDRKAHRNIEKLRISFYIGGKDMPPKWPDP